MGERIIGGYYMRSLNVEHEGIVLSLPRRDGGDPHLQWPLRYGEPDRKTLLAAASILETFEDLLARDEAEAIRRLRRLRRAYRRRIPDVNAEVESGDGV